MSDRFACCWDGLGRIWQNEAVFPIASGFLNERMGTAGPEDDALIIRVLLAGRRSKSLQRLSVNEFSPAEHANDASVAAHS